MLKIIYGKAGSGKTYKIKNIIAEMILSGSGDILFITPEQDSFRSESDILSLVGADKTDRADVLSFKRLAKKITDVFYPDRKPAADENSRLAVAEYLTRANFNMRNGNFELNMEDGEIRFKTYVHVGASKPDLGVAKLAVTLPFFMLDRFGDGLLEVLFGFKSPREAFEAAEGKK